MKDLIQMIKSLGYSDRNVKNAVQFASNDKDIVLSLYNIHKIDVNAIKKIVNDFGYIFYPTAPDHGAYVIMINYRRD